MNAATERVRGSEWLLLTCLIAVALLFPSVGESQTLVHEFKSEVLLKRALADISKMNREELDRFIDYLVGCDSTQALEAYEQNCKKAQSAYSLRYERGRAVDRYVTLIPLMRALIESRDKTAKPNTPEKDEVNNLLLQYVDTRRSLEDAARKAFIKAGATTHGKRAP